MVGNDTADKVWLRLVERLHQVGQLLLVELTNGTEHALACTLGTEFGSCRVSRILGMYADDVCRVLPEKGHHRISGGGKKLDKVVVEGIHVLHQPLLTVVLNLFFFGGGGGGGEG